MRAVWSGGTRVRRGELPVGRGVVGITIILTLENGV